MSINYNSLTEKNKKDPQETPGLSLVIKRKITLVRHGITEWNKKFRYQGITDVPLAAEGEEQAKRAAMRLSCESVDRVISSPLGRSMKTASIIAEIIGKNSVETWDDEGRLVGGLYGVHQNAMFAGESMFHDDDAGRDASKVALLRLVAELRRLGVDLLDVQWLTPHLASLGALAIDRDDYLDQLSEALEQPHRDGWRRGEGARLTGRELLHELGEDRHA